ncbi:hypothetical protein DICPUDRAFT_49817, partial [Dictyostelium purpureum]
MVSFESLINKIKKKKKLLPKKINIGNHNNNQQQCEIKKKFILILSWIPQITPVTPGPSSINLAIVLLINAVKEAYEDFRRYQSDKKINNQICKVIENNVIIEKFWKDLGEGDIVLIEDGQQFPTDLIILASSGESSPGHCYIETSNLDGETNLKYKQALLETNSILVESNSIATNNTSLESFQFFKDNESIIECEAPSVNLNKFDGTIQLKNGDISTKYPLTIDQLLVRGTTLMSTKYIYGCVIYVGHETKYMMNTMKTSSKRSKLELTMERILIYLLGFQLLLCLFSTLMGMKGDIQYGDSAWYLQIEHNIGFATFQRYFTFLILFSTIIPISLYVTMEIIRFLQVIFINKDRKMCHRENGVKTFACARTSNLNEELGMVEYIFSDKTGTLTRNEMEFKVCCINGKQYGSLPISSEDILENENLGNSISNDQQTPNNINNNIFNNTQTDLPLAICNTVVPEHSDTSSSSDKIKYSSSSPDETALVEAASNLGFKLYNRTSNSITIKTPPSECYPNQESPFKTFSILNVIEFTSNRKKMSIIVKDNTTNEIILYSKGADSSILPLVKDANNSSSNNLVGEVDTIMSSTISDNIMEKTKESLRVFSVNGLRTLCISKRILTTEEYGKWNAEYKEASLSMEDRDVKMEEASKLIECQLSLMGVTAIEDRLQKNVNNTISTLLKAGIKIWMLTGDKQETAINIGVSCSLLSDLELLILNESSIESEKKFNSEKQFGLVIDGNTLAYILLSKECEDLFYKLVNLCKSCVCCRVTPFQKSEVVRIVKDRTNSITLAIGDGANDVSMIQKAHLGIGISGKEGRQAVLASDFSIAQFRFLSRLLLVHGRYNYKRLCVVICYFFFKNLLSCLLQFWFSTSNLFSGTTYYDSLNTMLFNLVFTSLPIIVLGVFERDLCSKYLLKHPQLYQETQRGKCFNHKVFWSWIVLSIYCSAVIYFFSSYIYNESATDWSGKVGGLRNVSAFAFTCLVFIVNLRLAMIIQHWNYLNFISIGLSLFAFFLVECIYSLVYSFLGYRGEFYHVFLKVVEQPIFYTSLVLVILVCLVPPFTIKYIQRNYLPEPLDIIQEISK